MNLEHLGWNPAPQSRWSRMPSRPAARPGRGPAPRRLCRPRRRRRGRADVPGRLRHGEAELPAVGDWVASPHPHAERASIQAVLPRRTAFVRRAAGHETVEQVVAANVDIAFVVASLERRPQPAPARALPGAGLGERRRPGRRAHEGRPSTNVARGAARRGRASRSACPCTPSRRSPARASTQLAPTSRGGRTGTLLGSSGVGKSTLVNRLVGRGAAGDRRDPRRRPRPPHHHPPRAGPARRAAAA